MFNAMLFVTCVLIWGSTWYAIKFQLGNVPLEWSVAYRFFLSALILLLWCVISRRRLRFALRDHLLFAWLGALLFSINYMFVYWGTVYLTSGLVAVAFSMISLANQANGALFLRIKIEPKVLIGAVVGMTGLVLVFLPEFQRLSLDDTIIFGIFLCIVGTIIASFGNTLAATERAKSLPLFALNGYAMLYGSIIMAAYAVITGKPASFDTSSGYVLSLIYLSLFGTVAGFTIYLTLIKVWGLARTAYIAIAIPVVALFISTAFEGYVWTLPAILGVGLVLMGNMMLIRKKRPAPLAAPTGGGPAAG